MGIWLGGILAILVWAPARWLALGIEGVSGQRVQLVQIRGTVWSGSAVLMLTGGDGSRGAQTLPGRLHWQWGTDGLGLKLSLEADCCSVAPARINIRPERMGMVLRISDHTSHWPAGILTGLGAPWNTLQIEGELQLSSQDLQLYWGAGHLEMQGSLELVATDISSSLSTLRPLGSYKVLAHIGSQGNSTLGFELSTLSGALQLSGQGQWAGGRLRFTGMAAAEPGSETALSNLLNIIGRREGPRSLLSL